MRVRISEAPLGHPTVEILDCLPGFWFIARDVVKGIETNEKRRGVRPRVLDITYPAEELVELAKIVSQSKLRKR